MFKKMGVIDIYVLHLEIEFDLERRFFSHFRHPLVMQAKTHSAI